MQEKIKTNNPPPKIHTQISLFFPNQTRAYWSFEKLNVGILWEMNPSYIFCFFKGLFFWWLGSLQYYCSPVFPNNLFIPPLLVLPSLFLFVYVQELPQKIIALYLSLSSTPFSVTPTISMSSLNDSMNLLFGLSLCLLLGSPILSIILSIYSMQILCIFPHHHNLASLNLFPKHPNFTVPLMRLFLIPSILVTPKENLNILNSAKSCSVYCHLVIASVSKPNNIVCLTTIL